jgi:hypothetical protein
MSDFRFWREMRRERESDEYSERSRRDVIYILK